MKRKLAALLLSLVLLGALGAPAYAAESVEAQPSGNAIYVDGIRLGALSVYAIDGHNYFKLRDIAGYIDFSCQWNSEKRCIEVDTALPYDYVQTNTNLLDGPQSAAPSVNPLYVDGVLQKGLTAYTIAGNNYFKLRDLAGLLDFGCIWNKEKGCVEISTYYGYSPDDTWGEPNNRGETDKPQSGETQEPAVTEQEAYDRIIALKSQYPEGMKWTNDNYYFFEKANMHAYGCVAFAAICSDAAFGDAPVKGPYQDYESIRVGDIIRSGYHSFVVLSHSSESLTIAEGNYNSSIHRGRTITRAQLESTGFSVTTRY